MHTLLVLKHLDADLRVLVTLKNKRFKKQVISLLEKNRGKEALNVLKSRAEVKAYLPQGSKLPVRPDMVLFEDMLQ